MSTSNQDSTAGGLQEMSRHLAPKKWCNIFSLSQFGGVCSLRFFSSSISSSVTQEVVQYLQVGFRFAIIVFM